MKGIEARLEAQVLDAERAVKRYGNGELTDLEKQVGYIAHKLHKTWLETLIK